MEKITFPTESRYADIDHAKEVYTRVVQTTLNAGVSLEPELTDPERLTYVPWRVVGVAWAQLAYDDDHDRADDRLPPRATTGRCILHLPERL